MLSVASHHTEVKRVMKSGLPLYLLPDLLHVLAMRLPRKRDWHHVEIRRFWSALKN